MDAITAKVLVRKIVTLGSLLLAATSSPATVLEITGASQWRDHRGPNSLERRLEGDFHVLDVFVKDLFGAPPPAGTSVVATNDGFELELNRSSTIPEEFGRITLEFGEYPTTPWTITAESSGDVVTASTNDITGAPLLPFVRNVRIEPNGLTPTLRWDAPLGGIPATVDKVLIGLFDDESNDRLPWLDGNIFKGLPAEADSFTFAPGELEEDRSYVFRVVLEDRDPSGEDRVSWSTTHINFTTTNIVGGDETLFLPTVDADGVFRFDFDVEADRRFIVDPFFATGYEYAIGAGDPNFASVELPFIGDGEFLLSYLYGGSLVEWILAAGVEYVFPDGGVEAFTVMGIEASAMLDPTNVTAFATTLSFVENGAFTGTMTPITEFVPDSVPAPPSILLLSLGVIVARYTRRRTPAT